MARKRLTGYTENTMKNRQMNSGIFFKNFDIENDTVESAIAAGKLLGATSGGGSFTATPTVSTQQVDGITSGAVGMSSIDSWEVSMSANILEITEDSIRNVLGATNVEDATIGANPYRKITGKGNLDLDDYIENITFVGSLSGFEDSYVIIQIFNALSVTGISINPTDGGSSILSTTFKAHSTIENAGEPPFAIYIPVSA